MNPFRGILGRNYYLHFTDEEIEVQRAVVIVQNFLVKKKKAMKLNHSFSKSQRRKCPGFFFFSSALRESRRAACVGRESLEEASIDTQRSYSKKKNMFGGQVSIFRNIKGCEI